MRDETPGSAVRSTFNLTAPRLFAPPTPDIPDKYLFLLPAHKVVPCRTVKLPWQKPQNTKADNSDKSTTSADNKSSSAPSNSAQSSPAQANSASAEQTDLPKGYTPKKNKPTPSRKEQEIRRGVRRDPNGASPAQARERRKELKKSMSKQEWKEYKREERQENMRRRKKQQERMDAGDERYLLARDIGPERRYARDWVDSRAFLTNWVMLIALIILGATLLGGINPHAANIISLIGMVIIVILAIEGVILGKRCNNAVRKKFPDSTEAGLRLGFYAYSRATQPRKWRSPKPQVERGAKV